MNMRNLNHGFGRICKNFVVFAQTARIIQPSKSSLNYPTLSRFYVFRNVNSAVYKSIRVVNERATITHICTKPFYRWIRFRCKTYQSYSHCRIIQICPVNNYAQKTSQCIGYYVTLSAFCFFPPSKPRWSLA